MTTKTTIPWQDITLLTEEQIWGDENGLRQLEALRKYGTKTSLSDLSIVLGGSIAAHTTHEYNLQHGLVFTSSCNSSRNVRTVHASGNRDNREADERLCAVRPSLPVSIASKIDTHEATPLPQLPGITIVKYGEYPQTIAAKAIRPELDKAFSRNELNATGKRYVFDAMQNQALNVPFQAMECAEYEYKGIRYIKVQATPNDCTSKLSDGTTPQEGDMFWIEVQPIEWLVDKSGVWISRQALFAGVQFDTKQTYDGNFDAKDADGNYIIAMKRYLVEHFVREMMPQKEQERTTALTQANGSPAERPGAEIAPYISVIERNSFLTSIEKLEKIGITANETTGITFEERDTAFTQKLEDGDLTIFNAGVILRANTQTIKMLANQLTKVFKNDKEHGYSVTLLGKNEDGKAGLYISTSALDKLLELERRVDLTPPSKAHDANGR